MASLTASNEFELPRNSFEQLHFPDAALGPGHRVVLVIALIPGRSSCSVDEPALVRVSDKFCRDAFPGVIECAFVADHATVKPFTFLAFNPPAVLPFAVRL